MENLKEWIAKLWAPIIALLGAITAIVQFIQLWQGDQETVTKVLWVGGAILVCISLYYIGFSRESSPVIITTVWGKLTTNNVYKYGVHTSKIARGLFFLSLVAVITLGGVAWYRNNLLKDKVVVLIADFDGPDPKNYRVTEELLSQLSNSLSGYNDTVIIPLSEVVTEQEGSTVAQALGKRYNADLVIWGWYGVTESNVLVTIHVENLSNLKYFPLKSSSLYGMQLPTYEIKSFQIQQRLSSQMTALTLFLGGLIRYEADDYQGAINRLSQAIGEQWPDDLISKKFAFLYRGISYHWLSFNNQDSRVGDLNKATADFSQAIEIDPEFWEAYYYRIISYSYVNEYSKADEDYQLFITKVHSPTDVDGYNAFAYLAMAVTDDSKAIEYLSKIIENDPKDSISFFNRGQIYARMGEYEAGLDDLNKAIKLAPKSWVYYLARASAYIGMGKYELALKDTNQALDLHTSNNELNSSALILWERGLIYNDMGNYSKALDDLSNAIKLSPNSYVYYVDRGLAYLRLEEFQSAYQDFSIYLKNSDSSDFQEADAYYYRGFALDKLGYPEYALIDFSNAVESYSFNAKSWHDGRDKDYAQGECKGAIKNFQELSDNSKTDSIVEWANLVVKAFQASCPSKLVEKIPTKNLLTEIATNSLIPGSGLAGIKIGDSIDYVTDHLGNAVGWFRTEIPNVPDCCTLGTWGTRGSENIVLSILFSITDKKAVDFYLEGLQFSSPSEFIPLVKGVSIGTSEEVLLKNWGNPISSSSTKTPIGCTVIFYDGIRFRTCGENKLINAIDIPGIVFENP